MVTILKQGSKKDRINKLLKQLSENTRRGISTRKYSGRITLKSDPLEIQKAYRDEWE